MKCWEMVCLGERSIIARVHERVTHTWGQIGEAPFAILFEVFHSD